MPPDAGTSSQVSRREHLEKPYNRVIVPPPRRPWEALRPQMFAAIAQLLRHHMPRLGIPLTQRGTLAIQPDPHTE